MGRWSYAETQTVDESLSLSIKWLNQHGYFNQKKSGGITWKSSINEKSVSFSVDPEMMFIGFQYTVNGEPFDYQVRLSCTYPNYGGKRFYFHCPAIGCSKRQSVLYLVGIYFACRKCHGLQYRSSRKSGTRYSKLKKSIKNMDKLEKMRTLDSMQSHRDLVALELMIDLMEC
jgi:hypothetical protein